MQALHAFSANYGKGKNQDFTRLVLRKSIAAPFWGVEICVSHWKWILWTTSLHEIFVSFFYEIL